MNLSVILVGLVVLALFILPFYFVARKTGKEEKNHSDDVHSESHEQQKNITAKHKGYQKI